MAREKSELVSRKKTLGTPPAQAVGARRSAAVKGGVDAASPKLREAACKGTHIKEVVIEIWR